MLMLFLPIPCVASIEIETGPNVSTATSSAVSFVGVTYVQDLKLRSC